MFGENAVEGGGTEHCRVALRPAPRSTGGTGLGPPGASASKLSVLHW